MFLLLFVGDVFQNVVDLLLNCLDLLIYEGLLGVLLVIAALLITIVYTIIIIKSIIKFRQRISTILKLLVLVIRSEKVV